MICPFRKMTEAVDDKTKEYYMSCYGKDCLYYYKSMTYEGTEYEDCTRVVNETLGR